MEQIDGISEALGTSFESEEIDQKIQEQNDEIALLNVIPATASNGIDIEDKQLMRQELMGAIVSFRNVKDFLDAQFMRPGVKASEVEAAAMFSQTYLESIKMLRTLNMDQVNLKLAEKRLDQTMQIKAGTVNIQNNNNTFLLDSKTLDAMIENAEKNSKIKQIEVDFESDSQIK